MNTPFDYVLEEFDVKVSTSWTKEQIKEKIETDDTWLYRGLLAIYKLQTEDEKESGYTTKSNGIGFNGVDSEICSSFAQQLEKRKTLSPKQTAIARKIMKKYSGQLEKIANKKIKIGSVRTEIIKKVLAKLNN